MRSDPADTRTGFLQSHRSQPTRSPSQCVTVPSLLSPALVLFRSWGPSPRPGPPILHEFPSRPRLFAPSESSLYRPQLDGTTKRTVDVQTDRNQSHRIRPTRHPPRASSGLGTGVCRFRPRGPALSRRIGVGYGVARPGEPFPDHRKPTSLHSPLFSGLETPTIFVDPRVLPRPHVSPTLRVYGVPFYSSVLPSSVPLDSRLSRESSRRVRRRVSRVGCVTPTRVSIDIEGRPDQS